MATLKQVDDILRDMAGDDAAFDALAVDVQEMVYSGFEPKQFMILLLNKATAAGVALPAFKKDLATLATIGTLRGNNLTKIGSNSSQPLKTYMTIATRTYGIVSKVANKDTVTLTRIALVCARLLSTAFAAGKMQNLHAASITDARMPAAMGIPTFASLIPKLDDFTDQNQAVIMSDAFKRYQMRFDDTINGKKHRTAATTMAARKVEICKYFDIQYDSAFYSSEDRVLHCIKAGLIEADGPKNKIVPGLLVGLTAMAAEFNALV